MESLGNDPKEPLSSLQTTKSMFPWQVATAGAEIKALLAQSLCFMIFSTMYKVQRDRQNCQDTESRHCHRFYTRFYASWSHKISQTKTESSAPWGWSSADVALYLICDTSAAGKACILTNCYKLPMCLSLRCSMDLQPMKTNLQIVQMAVSTLNWLAKKLSLPALEKKKKWKKNQLSFPCSLGCLCQISGSMNK